MGVKYSVNKYDTRRVHGNSITVCVTARYGTETLFNNFFNRGHPVVFEFKNNTECFKVTVRTQHCINISMLLWQHVSVLLDRLQANFHRHEVGSSSKLFVACHELDYRVDVCRITKGAHIEHL